jgi:thioredoxin-like negative regulator of GroEL
MISRAIAFALGIACLASGQSGALAAAVKIPTIATTDAKFQHDVVEASADHLVVVVFEAGWCLPCRGVTGGLSYAAQTKGFGVVTMDVEANSVMADRLNVSTLPVVIAYRGGKAVGTHVGNWGGNYTLDNFLEQIGGTAVTPAE